MFAVNRALRPACLGALMLSALPEAAFGQVPASVRGVVRSAGRPVPRAEVGLVDGMIRVVADDSGRFVVRDLPAAKVRLYARAIGFLAQTVVVDLTEGGAEQDIELVAAAYELPELVAEARWVKPSRLAHTSKYDDFYRRRRAGHGTFLTREDLEKSTALRSFELLRAVPGVKVSWNPPGVPGTEVRFSRCTTFPPKIGVWIDGRRQTFHVPPAPPGVDVSGAVWPGTRTGAGEAVLTWKSTTWQAWLDLLDAVRPGEIEAVEVFRGVSQIPAEFLDDSCAAVVIWTREGGR